MPAAVWFQRNFRTLAMPLGMLVGVLVAHPATRAEQATGGMITPTLIFCMLFVTFCRIKMTRLRPQMLHLWLLVAQIVGSLAVYAILSTISPVLAQGGLICVLTPVAMASVVIAGMLGASVATMVTFSLLCNLVIALIAPSVLSLVGTGHVTFWGVLARVGPLLIGPFAAAQLCRLLLPRAAHWLAWHPQISFYIWLLSIVIAIGRTTTYILDLGVSQLGMEIALAAVALVLCVIQFTVGHAIGRRYGDSVAGGQSLGQKNTILAIWMSQSFLDPLSSIAPTAYIVWQNIANSVQLYRYNRK